jgi:hypothetical protein
MTPWPRQAGGQPSNELFALPPLSLSRKYKEPGGQAQSGHAGIESNRNQILFGIDLRHFGSDLKFVSLPADLNIQVEAFVQKIAKNCGMITKNLVSQRLIRSQRCIPFGRNGSQNGAIHRYRVDVGGPGITPVVSGPEHCSPVDDGNAYIGGVLSHAKDLSIEGKHEFTVREIEIPTIRRRRVVQARQGPLCCKAIAYGPGVAVDVLRVCLCLVEGDEELLAHQPPRIEFDHGLNLRRPVGLFQPRVPLPACLSGLDRKCSHF